MEDQRLIAGQRKDRGSSHQKTHGALWLLDRAPSSILAGGLTTEVVATAHLRRHEAPCALAIPSGFWRAYRNCTSRKRVASCWGRSSRLLIAASRDPCARLALRSTSIAHLHSYAHCLSLRLELRRPLNRAGPEHLFDLRDFQSLGDSLPFRDDALAVASGDCS